jgi:hypothetical protein
VSKNYLLFGLLVSTCAGAAVAQSWLKNRLDWVAYSARQANNLAAKSRNFEQFKRTVYREPFEGGGYIVNGDIYIPNEAGLLEFYLRGVMKNSDFGPALIIDAFHGYENVWPAGEKKALSYCVSTRFGSEHGRVVEAMTAAASAWERAADIKFVHVASEDARCTRQNPNVKFDVGPVNVGGQYLARAFFPNYARASRNVYIDNSAMKFPNTGDGLTLTGILRHELGHALGARHEHTRPEAGACFEDPNWIPITSYDGFSVMHYPQCKGLGDWTLRLTNTDQNGIACQYGAASGFVIDQSICRPRIPT